MPAIPGEAVFSNFALDAIMHGYMANGNVALLPSMLDELDLTCLEKAVYNEDP